MHVAGLVRRKREIALSVRILIAPDKFRGSLEAADVARAMARGVKRALPGATLDCVGMADGGEGFAETMVEALGGRFETIEARGPLGHPVQAKLGIVDDGATAVISMSSASGLALIPPEMKNPLLTSTFGTGQLIRAALDLGVSRIFVGIGGSATNDGGTGMAVALGYRFLGADGRELPLGGGALGRLEKIDAERRDPRLARVKIEVACDVSNPLCGPMGASAIYGPQKGATPEMVARLDQALETLATVIRRDLDKDVRDISGSGAAGGLGAGLVAFADGQLRRGIDLVIDATHLRDRMKAADLCLTGEGRIDHSSGYGKTVAGVARVARELGKPCVALGGSVASGADSVLDQGVTAFFSILTEPINLSHALEQESTRRRLGRTAEQVCRLWYGARPRDDSSKPTVATTDAVP
jgi:glycerate kinase